MSLRQFLWPDNNHAVHPRYPRHTGVRFCAADVSEQACLIAASEDSEASIGADVAGEVAVDVVAVGQGAGGIGCESLYFADLNGLQRIIGASSRVLIICVCRNLSAILT